MNPGVFVPLLLSALLAAASGTIATRLPPKRATLALVGGSVVAAVTSTWALALLTSAVVPGLLLRGLPELSEVGTGTFVRGTLSLGALVSLGVGARRLVRVVSSRRATRRELRALCAGHGGELVVAAAEAPHAFAVPGSPSRILVTTGMLRALDAGERRVLFAHERAHLRKRHHGLRAVAEVAAALNPLLIPVREAVAFLIERWADEAAAAEVGDRQLAARSLARAAIATREAEAAGGAMCFHYLAVRRRVAALQAPPVPDRKVPALGVALLVGTATGAVGQATAEFILILDLLLQ